MMVGTSPLLGGALPIALFVLVEKVVPGGAMVGRVTGAVLVAAGIALHTRGF